MISRFCLLSLICIASLIHISASRKPAKEKILVFSKTKGWHHTSIPFAISALYGISKELGYEMDTTTDASAFTEENLSSYKVVVFASTTGDVLNDVQQTAFEKYIRGGGGYVGIHSAADTEYDWPWYGQLMGAFFKSHPNNPNVRKATILIPSSPHPAVKGLPSSWTREDEWYNYRSFDPGIHVLASLDEHSYEGGLNGDYHPIAWYHEFDGGRAFYTGLGHTDETYSDPLFLKHLSGGIRYAAGAK